MAQEDQDKDAGVDSFLDRLESEINSASGADELAAQRDEGGDNVSAKDDAGSGEDLDSLRNDPGSDAGRPDPLDDLSDEANKGSTPKADAEGDEGNADESEGSPHADLLSEYDEEDRAKIQKYLDEKIAEELKLTESAGGAFKRIKSENRELEDKVRELETRTAEPEALKAATERIEELESQVRLNEEKNSAIRLEDTQAYQEAVTKPQQDILAASDKIADQYGVDRDQLASVLGNTNRRDLSEKINQLLGDDAADADKYELYELSRRAEGTFQKKRELFDNAEEALKEAQELEDKAKERAALQTRQERKEAATETVARIKAKAKFILDAVGDDVVEGFVEANADKPVEALSPTDQAFARFAFDALIPLAKQVRKLEDELQSANDDIVKLRGSGPGGDGGGAGGGSRTEEDDERKADTTSTGVETAVDRIGNALAGVS